MRRAIILSAIGLIAIISAALYVYSGAGHEMVWTYQQCVGWVTEPCHSASRFDMHCSNIAIRCIRFEPRLQKWVYDWLIESAAIAAIVWGLTPLTLRTAVPVR